MKIKIYTLFALVILLAGACKNAIISPLVGKWRAVESFNSIGGPLIYTKISSEENKYVQFKNNSTISSNIYEDNSIYAIKDNSTLTITLASSKTYDLYYRFDKDTLVISAACIEGCGTKFVKY